MSDISPKETPVQQGVQYVSCPAPTFNGGTLVPTGDTWAPKEVAEVDKSMDGVLDVDNIGTAGHRLNASADFKIKVGTAIPNVGDYITEDGASPARHWVIVGNVEPTGFSAGGKPIMIKLEIEYHKKVSDAIAAQNP